MASWYHWDESRLPQDLRDKPKSQWTDPDRRRRTEACSKSVVWIGPDDSGGGFVKVYGNNGKLASQLNVGSSDGGRMTVYNALGKEAASIQANKKNEGMVVVNNVNGEYGNALTVR